MWVVSSSSVVSDRLEPSVALLVLLVLGVLDDSVSDLWVSFTFGLLRCLLLRVWNCDKMFFKDSDGGVAANTFSISVTST